jgi:hypothetical protein
MTQDDLTERVLNVVGRPADAEALLALRGRILGLTEDALTELSADIADSDRAHELRTSFDLAIVDGEADLSTLLSDRLLLKFLPEADIRDSQGRKLFYIARSRYDLAQPAAYGYFTIEGQTLSARLQGEESGASNDTLTVSGNHTSTLSGLPVALEANQVATVVTLLAKKKPE